MTEQAEPDWDAVRDDYVAGEMLIEDIALRHGITENQLVYRRRRSGWPLRHAGTGRARRKNVILRMMRLIEGCLGAFEEAARETGAMNAADIRTLETMVKIMDRLFAMDDAEDKRAPKRKRPRVDPELEAIRERLIERVQAFETED